MSKSSAIHPSDDSTVTVEEQPHNQYGFSRQPGQPLSLIPATVLITPEHFKPYRITCPHCQEEITTETSFYMGSAAKSCVFASLFFCIWFGLFCVAFWPCYTNKFKDVKHTCPYCHKEVARYERRKIATWHQSPWLRERRGWDAAALHLQPRYGIKQQAEQAEAPPGVLIVQPTRMPTPEHFKPYDTICPHCNEHVTTEASYKMGDKAYHTIFRLLLVLCCIGLPILSLVPCCINRFKDVTHTCPRCHQIVAEYKRHEMNYF
ncbi:uncharacterized protein [Mytilus edulis]|uniref:uncharacterized protein n=1 Tax=Mytilus edulis TaxID=6550 RepID=UPI0039EF3388